jgi:O-antigen/teichoic acid export membrane protein
LTRTRRFAGGVSVTYTHQVLVTVVGLWLTPFLLGHMGAHQYGLWLTATQLIAYLTLLDLGVLALLPRDAACATGGDAGQTERDLPDVIARASWIVLWQMPLIAVATLVAWWSLPAAWQELERPLALLLVAFVLTYPLRIFQATLQGLQDLAFAGGLQLVSWAAGTVAAITLVVAGYGLLAVAIGALLTQAVSLVGCAVRVFGRFPAALPRALQPQSWAAVRPYMQRAGWVSVGQVAQILLNSTDILLVAWFFGPVTVVPYACTQKLITVLANQPQVLTQAAAPALSQLRTAASREKLFDVTSALSLALMLVSGGVVVVVIAMNRAFVSWWVGADQYAGALLTGLFALAMLLRHWNTALVYSLFAFGFERRLSITTVADGAVSFSLALLLARTIGVVGVPIGFIAGALLVSIPANVVALARTTGVSPAEFALSLSPWAIRLAALVPVAAAVNLFLPPDSVVILGVAAIGIGAAYAAMMIPVALRPPLGDYVRALLASFPLSRATCDVPHAAGDVQRAVERRT